MTCQLQQEGFLLNHKKVNRLMKENHLLALKKKVTKNYAKYRVLTPSDPAEMLEMDIKFAWVASEMKHAYILTVLDVFTRTALAWHAGFSIKTTHSEKSVGSSN